MSVTGRPEHEHRSAQRDDTPGSPTGRPEGELRNAQRNGATPSSAGRVSLQGIVKRHGAVTALHGIDLEIAPGEFFALLGPSGSGKTTTLRILAGLEEANAGRVLLDGRDVTDADPGARDVAMVFQSYALYPHMNVFDNIAFPLRMVGTPKADIASGVREAAAKVHIDHLLERRPGQLSGGQQQRVALARAIVRKPRLFLLDEPLSNLDAKLRLETRVELRRLQRSLDVTAVYVTHDQEEAMTIADRMAIFIDGRIVQVGTPEAVFAQPASMAVAGFLGSPPMNLVPGTIRGGEVEIGGHRLGIGRRFADTERVADGERPVGGERPADAAEGLRLAEGQRVVVGIRPGSVRLAAEGIPGRIELVEQLGESALVDVAVDGAMVRVRVDRRGGLRDGEAVRLQFPVEHILLFDPETGGRIPAVA